MIRLRVHHLLCSALYVGKGYSEEFCENMENIVQRLWERQANSDDEIREVMLTSGPDNICKHCPNLVNDICKLDCNSVVSKDAALAQKLGLEIDRIYSVAELLHTTHGNLTEKIFEQSCSNCLWFKQGLCDYEKLAEKYASVNNDRR